MTTSHSGNHKTLALIDGHALAYRMYFALEMTQMKTAKQEPTWAIFGFFNALFSLLQTNKPDALAVSFDLSGDTFRNQMYQAYKAHREKMPDELRDQMDRIKEGVRLLGIPIYELENYEADDVIGTLSKQAASEGWHVHILTGDQDAFQLVHDTKETDPQGHIRVLIPSRKPREGLKVYDCQEVFQKLGVYPHQVIDYKGLRGDTSDNIPGIPGVGEKTAVKLLSEFQTMENLYANLEKLPKNKLLEKLVTHQDQALLSKQLATIVLDAPVQDVNFEDCHLVIPDMEALLQFFERCEFRNFIRQASSVLAPFTVSSAVATTPKSAVTPTVVNSVVEETEAAKTPIEPSAVLKETLRVPHQVLTTEADLTKLVQRIQKLGVLALDIETTGLDVFNDQLVGIAISTAEGLALESWPVANPLKLKNYPSDLLGLKATQAKLSPIETVYIPVGHEGDSIQQLSTAVVLDALRPVLTDAKIVKIAHNAKFEINFFEQLGITWTTPVYDTMIAGYVDNPESRNGLKAMGFQYFQYLMQEIKTLIGSGKNEIPFSKVPVEPAAEYAACDSYVTLQLAHYFASRLKPEQKTLLTEIELPLMWVIAKLERTGVSLDTPYLNSLSEMLNTQIEAIEQEIYRLAGLPFNINSPKQVGEVIFTRLGISPGKKTKGKTGFSTDVKVLEQLSGEHPVIDKILEYRQLFKLKSTYIDALPALISSKTHRLHTSFNQTVTATGRLSSSTPNLQNIPIRTELGSRIRKAFIPEKVGWKLLSADYSQIELRLLAHFSKDPNLVSAFNNNEDIHQATAALVFGLPMDKVNKEMRYKAKAVNFGVVYGQSAHGLSQQLKIPRVEAAEFIDRYFFKYKNVKTFIESVKAEAHQTGEVHTLCGRSRNLKEGLTSSIRSIREFSERAAFNTPLQGSAADLMKIAMIRLANQLEKQQLKTRMILQVHDELVLEVPDEELEQVKAMVVDAMTLEQPLLVPLVVDVAVGPSWLESD